MCQDCNFASPSEEYYMLVQDDSSHWYIIETNKKDDWNKFLKSKEAELGTVPDYADEVGGSPSLVKFTHHFIDN